MIHQGVFGAIASSAELVAALSLTSPAVRYVARSDYVTLSSSSVTGLQDISGNANHLSGGVAPTWNATGLNGKPTIVHSLTTYLNAADAASLNISVGMSWYCVGRYANFADNEHNTFVTKGAHGIGLNYLFGKASSSFSNLQKFVYVDSTFRDVIESSGFIGTNNRFYVFCTVVDKTNGLAKFYVDGVLKSSVSNSLNYAGGNATGLRVGANSVATEGLNGAWSEQVIDRSAHSGATVLSNTQALGAYWGITL